MDGKAGFKHQFVRVLRTGFHGRRICEQGSKNVLENRKNQCESPVVDSMTPLCSWFFLSIDSHLSSEACNRLSPYPRGRGAAGSPSTLTVNRPLVLFRLPMKNRAPLTDRVCGKGISAILKPEWTGLVPKKNLICL